MTSINLRSGISLLNGIRDVARVAALGATIADSISTSAGLCSAGIVDTACSSIKIVLLVAGWSCSNSDCCANRNKNEDANGMSLTELIIRLGAGTCSAVGGSLMIASSQVDKDSSQSGKTNSLALAGVALTVIGYTISKGIDGYFKNSTEQPRPSADSNRQEAVQLTSKQSNPIKTAKNGKYLQVSTFG